MVPARPSFGIFMTNALKAIWSAASGRSAVIRLPIDHPTILRQYRSSTTARYNQPSVVLMNVISAAHTRFGSATSNCRINRFSATGRAWPESVVLLEHRFPRPRRPAARISRATRWREQRTPVARSSRYTLGEPYRPLLSSRTVSMCARSCASSSTRFCRPVATNGTRSRSHPPSDTAPGEGTEVAGCGRTNNSSCFLGKPDRG